jgi:hypothetical protein
MLNDQPSIDVLGKKFDYHCTFIHILQVLKKQYKNFGYRAREAKNNQGVDYKALSHAVRVSLQGIELLNDHKITLPHNSENAKLLLDIKTGKMVVKEVSILIEKLLNELEEAKEKSTLSEEIDKDLVDNFVKICYAEIVGGEYGFTKKR